MSASSVPQRWHVYVVDLEPRVRSKPGKQRPCVAIQPTELALAGLPSTVILPLTTRITEVDAFPLRVRIPAGVCGLAHDSDVLVDQILAWDNSLFGRDLGLLPDALALRLREALLDFLELAGA
ncbi:MAG: type II toxin-antitoxin system PemK/MazF family toxin [Thermodesulfobacteriota bacterium]